MYQTTRKLRQFFTAIALLTIAMTASANERQLITLVEAIELSPSNVIMPGSVNGMVTFKACVEACDEQYRRARLTTDTQFYVAGRRLKFEDFQTDFNNIKQRPDGYALIRVDAKSRTITRIDIQG